MARKLRTIEIERMSVEEFHRAEKMPLVVVLDDVRSLYNVGSVFRTCDAFRVESIYLCGITATPPSTEIHKTALGAEDSVDWKYFSSAEDAVTELKAKGYTVYAIEQAEGSIMLSEVNSPLPASSRGGRGAEISSNRMAEKRTDKLSSLVPHLSSLKREGAVAVVLGNEVKGVHQSVIDLCDGCLEIPQYGTKHSLNVSVAAGIVVWEFFSKFCHHLA